MAQRASTLAGTFNSTTVRQYCQQYFSVERMVADYAALYQELVAEDGVLGNVTSALPIVA